MAQQTFNEQIHAITTNEDGVLFVVGKVKPDDTDLNKLAMDTPSNLVFWLQNRWHTVTVTSAVAPLTLTNATKIVCDSDYNIYIYISPDLYKCPLLINGNPATYTNIATATAATATATAATSYHTMSQINSMVYSNGRIYYTTGIAVSYILLSAPLTNAHTGVTIAAGIGSIKKLNIENGVLYASTTANIYVADLNDANGELKFNTAAIIGTSDNYGDTINSFKDTTGSSISILTFGMYEGWLYIVTSNTLYVYKNTFTHTYQLYNTTQIEQFNDIYVHNVVALCGTNSLQIYPNFTIVSDFNEYNAVVAQNIQIQTQLDNLVSIYSIDDKQSYYKGQSVTLMSTLYYYLFILYYIVAVVSLYYIYKSSKNNYIKAGLILYIFVYPYIVNPILYYMYDVLLYLYSIITATIYQL